MSSTCSTSACGEGVPRHAAHKPRVRSQARTGRDGRLKKTIDEWIKLINASEGRATLVLWTEAVNDIRPPEASVAFFAENRDVKEREITGEAGELLKMLHVACVDALNSANEHPNVIADMEKRLGPRAKWR